MVGYLQRKGVHTHTHHSLVVLLFDRPLMHSPHPDRDTQDSRMCARETLTLAIHLRYRFFYRLTEEIAVVAEH